MKCKDFDGILVKNLFNNMWELFNSFVWGFFLLLYARI